MLTPAPQTLGLDGRSLDGLRSQASKDPRAATRQAALQFEGQFMQMVLKSMRDTTMKAEGGSAGQDSFTSMLDAQFASSMAGRPGGLADMIEKQLAAQMRAMPTLPPQPAPAQAPVAAPAFQGVAAPAAAAGAARGARPSQAQSDFLQRMLPHAEAAERATGVPASFILGQAALESGWGRGEIRKGDGSSSFNLFGIKASRGWQGDTATARTTEYVDGQAQRRHESFRSYGSYAEAFTDFARLISGSPRYSQAVRSAGSAQEYASAMQRAGYATDPQYASKLARTIEHTLAIQQARA